MLKVDYIKTYGWEAAIRGMRNPKNSWDLSDSQRMTIPPIFKLGPKDLTLCTNLIKAGSDHRKFLRQIFISLDITAPLYWWKEFDTYKIGTTSNSCSTMHKLCSKPFTIDDFSFEDLKTETAKTLAKKIIEVLEDKRLEATKNVETWREIVQLLPSSYNQTRTITMDYEVALRIYQARCNHKLTEWHTLCNAFIKELPYFMNFIEVML